MAYVGNGSGNTQTADERMAEAHRILKILEDCGPMTDKEFQFVHSIEEAEFITPKQLWWLRDIKAKYAN